MVGVDYHSRVPREEHPVSANDSRTPALLFVALGLVALCTAACTASRRVERFEREQDAPNAGAPVGGSRAPRGSNGANADDSSSDGGAGQPQPADASLPPDTRGCFSPIADTQLALQPDALGCKCDVEGLQVCVEGVALICQRTYTEEPVAFDRRWALLPSERCVASPECRAVNRRPDVLACLADYASCTELQDGDFCGGRCRGELDCDRVDCEDYRPTDFVCDDSGGPWEGRCDGGLVRYRAESGRGTRYWNETSGKLVAIQLASDAMTFCDGSDQNMILGEVGAVEGCAVVTDDSTAVCMQDRCSEGPATRVGDGCTFALGAPLSPSLCQAEVTLNGQVLTCNDPNGWSAIDRFHILLDGSACELVQSGEPIAVQVRVPCSLLPI
jgi:hypothetical protein